MNSQPEMGSESQAEPVDDTQALGSDVIAGSEPKSEPD